MISNDEFVDQNWTTEHYAEYGRRLIAKNVGIALQKFYPHEFNDKDASIVKPKIFFNDCEGEIVWSQMQTLTNEFYHSGKQSSRSGQKQDFGLSFDYAIKNLPDSLKSVSINFYKYQYSIIKDAKIVVQISGSRIKYQWNGFLISDLNNSLNKWAQVKLNFDLPKDFYSASMIKIYVFNPTNELIFVDDIEIEFKNN